MKKISAFLIFGVIIVLVGILGWNWLNSQKKNSSSLKASALPKIEAINKLALEKRPYMILEPTSTTRPQDVGHWITVTLDNVNNYDGVDYDIEYMSGNLIQGFMHKIDFTKEKAPFSKEGFFGSESKGKYKYDENVKSGNILLKFYKGDQIDNLKTFFNLQNMLDQKGIFTSNDAKATLKITGNELASGDFVIISSTLGLPSSITGKAISDPYGFYSTKPTKLKNAELTIKSKEDLTKAKILGWDGKKWQEYKIKIEADQAIASVSQLGTYILVSE